MIKENWRIFIQNNINNSYDYLLLHPFATNKPVQICGVVHFWHSLNVLDQFCSQPENKKKLFSPGTMMTSKLLKYIIYLKIFSLLKG